MAPAQKREKKRWVLSLSRLLSISAIYLAIGLIFFLFFSLSLSVVVVKNENVFEKKMSRDVLRRRSSFLGIAFELAHHGSFKIVIGSLTTNMHTYLLLRTHGHILVGRKNTCPRKTDRGEELRKNYQIVDNTGTNDLFFKLSMRQVWEAGWVWGDVSEYVVVIVTGWKRRKNIHVCA